MRTLERFRLTGRDLGVMAASGAALLGLLAYARI
jgi:hypothetical protein